MGEKDAASFTVGTGLIRAGTGWRSLPPWLVAGFPVTASANVGTALMWVSMLHLIFGNAVIGLVEGLLLAAMFRCSKGRAAVLLILANYASAWAGGWLVTRHVTALPDVTILNLQSWLLLFAVVAFVITLLIELPFVWLLVRARRNALRLALAGSVVVHVVSYALLALWYWSASSTSMVTRLTQVPAEEMRLPEPAVLYFITPDGGQVVSMNLQNPAPPRPFLPVTAPGRDDRLFARPREEGGFDLMLQPGRQGMEDAGALVLRESFAQRAPVDWQIAKGLSDKAPATLDNRGQVPSLDAGADWAFHTGYWPADGIRGVNEKAGTEVQYAVETPFAMWPVRNAIQLQGGYVVFQLGDDQICLLDVARRRLALLARGKGPLVAMP